MYYEKELEFLCEALNKCRVQASVVSPAEMTNEDIDRRFNGELIDHFGVDRAWHRLIETIEPNTLYKTENEFKLRFIFLLLPEVREQRRILVIGPYLSSPLSSRDLLELAEKLKIPPKSQRYLEEYYLTIPVVADGDRLIIMIDTLCERIWGSTSFTVLDSGKAGRHSELPIAESVHSESYDDVLMNMKTMEKRYEFENEMIKAVSLGQIHKESMFNTSMSDNLFEKRVSDPIRNAKNYGIIMNTLLRKAAENGGVHPVYLDRVSSDFASKIERIESLSDNSALMKDMFRSYCRLVRKHSIKKYSPVVQKTILMIDADLSADLSLSALATHQEISPGYLSTVFKKETGKTVSEYVREKRIKHAIHLLGTTHLQVQTVALHCGIMDVQYFSKIFKKQTGKTPKEYRESIRI
jgi:AraC-like DNA-binding protein